VPYWGDRYVAYAYNAGITSGVSAELFAPDRSVTHREFTAFLLRSLNYSEKSGDFEYENALQKAVSVGLYTSQESSKNPYLRGDAISDMTKALFTKSKDSAKTLLDTLADSNAITKEKAEAFNNSLIE
jgi:gas vesicle protein